MKHPFYIVIGTYQQRPFLYEQEIDGSEAEWARIIDQMWSGELEDVQAIYRADPASGKLADVTNAAAKTLSAMSYSKWEPPHAELASWIIAQGEDHFEPEITRAEYIDSISEDYTKERRFA